jgi:hypothetical protein
MKLDHQGFTMSLFDFLFRPPTKEKFAKLVLREMRRAGVEDELKYDAQNDRILRGNGNQTASIYLTNFYKEYLALPRLQRKKHLAHRALMFLNNHIDIPSGFETARLNLRPKIWVRAALEKARLQIQIDGGDSSKFEIPEYEIGSHLIASLVYDLPDTMMSINNEQLETWGVTYYEALEIAKENLEKTPSAFAQIGADCFASATGDSYDACRLLLPNLIEGFEVKGDLIAMVPNRDTLILAGSDDPESLSIMVDLTRKALEDPRPMVPIPLRLDGDAWVDWLPDKNHPHSDSFLDLARQFLHQEYADQKLMLERLHEKKTVDIFVATYNVIKKDNGQLFSYAVWANGARTLLPKTEWVMFLRGKDDLASVVGWDKAEQIVGRLMKPTDHYPIRVLVDEFPDDAELANLGKTEP